MPSDKPKEQDVSRRIFLKAGMAVGGGLMIGWGWLENSVSAELNTGDSVPSNFTPNAFLTLDRNGKATVISPAIEMGQGTYTSLPMLVAEELDIDMQDVSVDHAPPNKGLYGNPNIGGAQITGGSNSIRGFFSPMREAGAAARQMLIAAAAAKLGVDESSLTTDAGHVMQAESGRRVPYGLLVDDAAKLPVPTVVKIKDPSEFRIIGRPVRRLDADGKIDGSAVYSIDAKVPNMKIAAVAASPVFGGTLASAEEAAALAVAGVHQVVKLDNAAAVLADHYWAAKKGLEAAKPKFDNGRYSSLSTADIVAALAKASERKGVVAKSVGDISSALSKADIALDSVYEAPFLAHAAMEPINCMAHVTSNGCDIWVGTQIPSIAQMIVADALDLEPEQVRIHNHLLGGSFGRRLEADFILQAALIAKNTKDPVKVIWSREEDIQHDMYRPYYYDLISAGLDAEGTVVGWKHRIVGSSIMARFAPGSVKDGVDPDAVEAASDLIYDIRNFYVDYVREEPPGIPTAFWRGVGPTANAYVVESFVDELAAAADKDPVDFRRGLLAKNPRALHVVERAAAISAWGTPLGARRGRGIAFLHAFGTYLAEVAEVSVADDGQVSVDRVVAAVDCGLVVNPDTVEAQLQSGIIFGATAVLWGEITLKDGRVEQSNFDSYRMLRINETPVIETEIVKSTAKPGGLGEPGTSALAPAVLNAVYAATGVRLRKLPIKPDLLKA